MGKRTATQRASADLARAVFENTAMREQFERMARETGAREPVADDFSWLATDGETEHSRFESLTRKLLAVPKAAIDAARGKDATSP